MMGPGLSYEDTPPFSAPLRFFLTAPLFGVAAGLTLIFGGEVLVSRWTPGALAIAHLFAAGFMLQVMLGALVQVMPVAAGASMPAPLRIARITHVTMTLGAAGLAAGLGTGTPAALLGGAVLLVGSLAFFVSAAAFGLARSAGSGGSGARTPRDLRMAFAGLAVTAVLGFTLALAVGRGMALPVPLPTLVNLHAGWGWMGWAAVLLAAISWVVVPMFQITAAYPQRFSALWAPAVTGTLVLWTIAEFLALDGARITAIIVLGALGAGYAGITLYLQAHSRRSKPDTPFLAFRQAMYAALAGVLVLIVSLWSDADQWPVLAGVLILHGGFGGTITAMLYKIVPFLAWLHLTQAGLKAPNMKKLLPDTPIRRQLHVRTASLASLSVAVFLPVLAPLAGVALAVEFGWLFANLMRVVRARRDAAKNAAPRPGSHASA